MWLAAWTGRAPAVTRPLVAIFAGNHGVTKNGITPYPSSVTQRWWKTLPPVAPRSTRSASRMTSA